MKKRILSVVLAAAMLIGTAAAALMQAPAVPAQAAAGGAYISEINGEPTRTSVQGVRPIAVMIDNDRAALPHFGLAQADVVYELVNSTANNRITRLMIVLKDWGKIKTGTKDTLSEFVWRKTKRRPMILPIIQEV